MSLIRFQPSSLFTSFIHREFNAHPSKFKERVIYLLTDQDVSSFDLAGAINLPSSDVLSSEQISKGVFYVYFLCDSDALPEISRIKLHGGVYIPHLDFSKTQYRFVDKLAHLALASTLNLKDRISHFDFSVHENICEALNLTKNLEGDYVEVGVYLGGSALTALHYLDLLQKDKTSKPRRKAILFDTFDGFNYEQAFQSSDAIWAGTHKLHGENETIEFIRQTYSEIETDYSLHKLNICDNDIYPFTKSISVANLDVDMYEPTLIGLRKLSPLMQTGGVIICEDAASTPGLYGAYLAMNEFLSSEEGGRYYKIFKGSQYFLIKHS